MIFCPVASWPRRYGKLGLRDLAGEMHEQIRARLAAILKTIARRESDLVARYGGEEFAVILPGLEGAQAIALAEDILAAVRKACIANPSSPFGGLLTVSVGVTTVWRGQAETARSIVLSADTALYQAKRAGRNRAEVAGATNILTEEEVALDVAV